MRCFNPDMLQPGDLFAWIRSSGQRKRTYLDQQYKMYSIIQRKYFNCTTSILIDIDYVTNTYTFINESHIYSMPITTVAQHKFLRELVPVCIGII
jgi:hypothetical protein